MNDVDWNFPNPLSIDLRRQTSYLIESLPHDSNYADILKNASSPADLLRHLSRLLAHPSLTIAVEVRFRPLLLDLCVRWLDYEEHMYDKLEAFALLIEFHEELYPVMLNFLRHQHFTNGILPNVLTTPSFEDVSLLHRVLLAYYRILRANRFFPYDLYWDLSPLVTLFSTPHSDRGVCWLAIRCYALQSGMGDAEREKLEVQVLGEIGKDDCPVYYGQDIVQNPQTIDGWLLPVIELKRIENAREHILDSQDYYTSEESDDLFSLRQEDLSPHIVNIHGVLFHHIPSIQHVSSSLIETPSTITSLRKLAVNVSLRLPTLLTSSPSSGKSSLLDYLAKKLHPTAINHVVTIHLADTSLDPRSLLGSYVSSPANPGSFEWKEGAIVRAMREGKWLVLKDLDRSSSEILGLLSPLAESCGLGKRIGTQASITVPGRGTVRAAEDFVLFATRSLEQSRNGGFSPAAFLNAHKWSEVVIPSPSERDLEIIMDAKFPHMAGVIIRSIIALWRSIKGVQTSTSSRQVGLRNLESFALRLSSLLDSTILRTVKTDMAASLAVSLSDVIPHPAIREDIFLEARDVFFGEGTTSESSYARLLAVAAIVAENLGIGPERRDWVTTKPVRFDIEKDVDGRSKSVMVGRTKLSIWPKSNSIESVPSRPFTMHKPALHLFSRIATCISLCEPVLLTGETGTGKTSLVTHVAALLNRPLISLNLSTQTETSDLVGGFRPVDTRIPGFELQHRFTELFSDTFSVKKNGKFVETVRKAATNLQWRKAAKLWTESVRLALEKLPDPDHLTGTPKDDLDSVIPRKRQKLQDGSSHLLRSQWLAFERGLQAFEAVHIRDEGRVAFSFMEGPLVKALRTGTWVLLDEINLANPETLECLSSILQSSSSSITLTDQGALEPVPRHPEFRLFACMNPATDVGKKDLPSHLRARFTEIDVLPPDADRETLLSIISQYIGHCAVSDKAAVLDVAEFYTAVKELSFRRHLADGSNHRPHYSMRTLTRMLTFTSDIASMYGLRRALWEGCLMAFTMILDAPSEDLVLGLARRHLLSSVKNIKSTLAQMPSATQIQTLGPAIQFGPFWLEVGPFAPESADDYILTSSVQKKIVDLSRIIITRRFPVLIEGPTSSGKTSAVHYLARRTGHRFVRINNHEHTDLQEYLGSYVSDPDTGKLKFQDGLLVRALKEGDWIVLDELNLAPSDVLEALNRLLDDNRELFIPETNEVVKPHPHFMLFATQNPPGVYAGRKVLSRAFRNRFLEVHFDDVPQSELESILCQRCQIAPSYGQRIVSVFHELQNRRQAGRVFEGKHGFATLRDLFRWAQRDALSYQELAENGFMLLAERTRRQDDKTVVKEVIEKIMNVRIDEDSIYDPASGKIDITSYLGCHIPSNDAIVWTKGMRRLFILVSRALRFNEPVLLVGETGCGKTSVCQVYADATQKLLVTVNCHQNIEAADLIGGQRPVRQRKSLKSVVVAEAKTFLSRFGVQVSTEDSAELLQSLLAVQHSPAMTVDQRKALTDIQSKIQLSLKIFEWHDGPLVSSMREGDIFLLDEISLADDSVLERLNSVLEPTRAIVLAEKGGEDVRASQVIATEDFKLLATMNPGGDYGKKELSPALRNRFTEIWVPSVMLRADLEQIVSNMWNHDELRPLTNPLLDFTEWLCLRVGDDTLIGLRDIMAWVTFCNSVHGSSGLHPNVAFHHGAFMTLIDGLASFPTLSSRSQNALDNLKAEAITKLAGLVPISGMSLEKDPTEVSVSQSALKIGLFSIASGAHSSTSQPFNLNAPTSRLNAMRVIRACQLMKPILLEGSPGVGKTSLVAALAGSAGRNLRRINLSEQTDLVDLFGSDLPSASGELGEFSWKDATFLRALQNGDWVLLDEMNLAPQSVLEGLNAVLDHRGTVYIPELDRSFIRHPDFRIFAAQNPFHQGGGRKGLPKSFVNRFTKVYVDALSPDDMLLICRHLFPNLPTSILRQMIIFNSSLNDQAKAGKFDGGPWEFNLRDLIRWASLLQQVPRAGGTIRPDEFVDVVYGGFRRDIDRAQVRQLYKAAFGVPPDCTRPGPFLSKYHIQCGNCFIRRSNNSQYRSPETIFPAHLKGFQAALAGISQNWLIIVTGPHRSGKTAFVRSMAQFGGQDIQEISLNSATDTADLLGSFEQVDARYHIRKVLHDIRRIYEESLRRPSVTQPHQCYHLLQLRRVLRDGIQTVPVDQLVKLGWDALHSLPSVDPQTLSMFSSELERCRQVFNHTGSFEWIDGPLVRALKTGTWLVLDGVNLCSPSVLDRLNSLCESGGNLVLSERGDESQVLVPHNNFRIFMIVDPRHGELSRAMRNRGVEISLDDFNNQQSSERLLDIFRLPRSVSCDFQKSSTQDAFITFELTRRALKLGPVERRSTGSWTSNDLGAEDSLSANLHSLYGFVTQVVGQVDTDAVALLLASLSSPSYLHHFTRMIKVLMTSFPPDVAERIAYVLNVELHRIQEGLTANIRQEYAHKWTRVADMLQFQPLDFFLNSAFFDTTNEVDVTDRLILKHLIEFHVRLALHERDSLAAVFPRRTDDSVVIDQTTHSGKGRNGELAAHRFVTGISPVMRSLLSVISLSTKEDAMASLKLSLDLLSCTTHIREALYSIPFDFSSVLSITRWIKDSLHSYSPSHAETTVLCHQLCSAFALTNGHLLLDIWRTIFPADCSRSSHRLLEELHNAHENVPSSKTIMLHRIRARSLELVAIDMLASVRSIVKPDIEHILAEIQLLKFQTSPSGDSYSPELQKVGHMLVMELPSLLAISSFSKTTISHEENQTLQLLMRMASQSPISNLTRFVSYQHVLWKLEAGGNRVSDVVCVWIEWLKGLWNESNEKSELPDGPSILMSPILLESSLRICHLEDQSLGTIEVYQKNLTDNLEFSFLERARMSRTQGVVAFLLHNIILLCGCFPQSFDENLFNNLRRSSSGEDFGSQESIHSTVVLLESCDDLAVLSSISATVLPALHDLTRYPQSVSRQWSTIGLCWVALSRLSILLYVPDIPVDPAAVQTCRKQFLDRKKSWIQSQIQLHEILETWTTGFSTNPTIDILKKELLAVAPAVDNECIVQRLHGVSHLHAFWKEVQRFTQDMLSNNDLERLLASFKGGATSSTSQQEEVLQASIGTFLQRLKVAYPSYDDLITPLELCFLQLRLGLRLVSTSAMLAESRLDYSPNGIVGFPSVAAAASLHGMNLAWLVSNSFPLPRVLLLRLCSHVYDSLTGVGVDYFISDIDNVYEQIVRLWLIDCSRNAEKEELSQSLYRRKATDDTVPESELEEEEFKSLFPTFEEEVESLDATRGSVQSQHTENNIQKEQILQSFQCHLAMFAGDVNSRSASELYWRDERRQLIEAMLSEQCPNLSSDADNASLPFRIDLFRRTLEFITRADHGESYSFYADPNASEAKKLVPILRSLIDRLEKLIEEWPEQMVLRNLLDRCHRIMSQSVSSPVAKLLTGLEQLMLQMEDWEMFSNRDNSLKGYQQDLTSLIVVWRRLELSSWPQLLTVQAKDFNTGVAEWWFRLYDATVRGTSSVGEETATGEQTPIDKYLDTLVPLLHEFMTSSPIGQFLTRIALLKSFKTYISVLVESKIGPVAIALKRSAHVIYSVTQYFDQFSTLIEASLSEQTKSVQREITGFVKLASWRDINVQALRQSARHTHRQLYKSIRKFREILRQPVTPLLQGAKVPEAKEAMPIDVAKPHYLPENHFELLGPIGASINHKRPSYLVNISSTFSKFTNLFSNDVQSLVNLRPAAAIESLCTMIFNTLHELSLASALVGVPAADRRKRQKALLVQKRRAWSDLLKELKRIGIPAGIKPEILRRQSDIRCLMELPAPAITRTGHLTEAVTTGEEYFYRNLVVVSELRDGLSHHHPDLSTNDLQRGTTFVESAFSIAIRSRSNLAGILADYHRLQSIRERLKMIATSGCLCCFRVEMADKLETAICHICRLLDGMKEIRRGCEALDDSSEFATHISTATTDAIVNHISVGEQIKLGLLSVRRDVSLTEPRLFLKADRDIMEAALAYMHDSRVLLQSLAERERILRHMCIALNEWLRSQILTIPNIADVDQSYNMRDSDAVIESLLISAQTLLTHCPEDLGLLETTERDNHVQTAEAQLDKVASSLSIKSIIKKLEGLVNSIPNMSKPSLDVALATLLPFLTQYTTFVEEQLAIRSRWTKSMFKLVYVLSSVMNRASREGFCKPSDLEEDGDEKGESNAVGGVGFGHGSGPENVGGEIEDESQVEGIQNPQDGEDEARNNEDGEDENAIEMSNDIGGSLEDVPEKDSVQDDDEERVSEDEMDEQMGHGEDGGDTMVDEKMWGDETERPDEGKTEANTKSKPGTAEVTAKEETSKPGKEENKDGSRSEEESESVDGVNEDVASQADDAPDHSGAPMDVPNPEEHLDLPDGMDFDEDDGGDRAQQNDDDELADESEDPQDGLNVIEDPDSEIPLDEELGDDGASGQQPLQEDNDMTDSVGEDASKAQADIQAGDNISAQSKSGGTVDGETGEVNRDDTETQPTGDPNGDNPPRSENNPQNDSTSRESNDISGGPATEGSGSVAELDSMATTSSTERAIPNPLRSLGDALREVRKRISEIQQSSGSRQPQNEPPSEAVEPSVLEYVEPDSTEETMQALGPSGDEQAAKLSQLKLVDETDGGDYQDVDMVTEEHAQESIPPTQTQATQPTTSSNDEGDQSLQGSHIHIPSVVPGDVEQDQDGSLSHGMDVDESEGEAPQDVELELRQWRSHGQPTVDGNHIWHLYESLTHSLAYSLCEQLRLILEPTMASRLKGDYRTGKRLNMKKIIPYIASEYTKDKIWLRRTRPSQREYQVLVALDDSRSMAESHSIHLAYQTLALVSRALSRLEVGDIAIAKFGETVDVLHDFDGGPFSDQTGANVVGAFHFDQKATNVLSLVETSLKVLMDARERRSMRSSSSADLWQLEIIISDGICQDHEKLRTVLRKAEEQRILIVFIVVDAIAPSAQGSTSATTPASHQSILNMNQVSYKDVNGRMELQMQRYLDSFPFEYFVILRNVEALPDVLSNTLKQFFERITED